MRPTRVILLLFIASMAGSVAWVYRDRIRINKGQEIAMPEKVGAGISGQAEDWTWSQTTAGGKPAVEIRAKNFEQRTDPPRIDLKQVELKIYSKDGASFDLVKSNQAEFHMNETKLYSDGDVDITMRVPTDDKAPPSRIVNVKSSGISFDTKTGRAASGRRTYFETERGKGSGVGATYDPATRELRLHDQVELVWQGKAPAKKGDKPKGLKVWAGEAVYQEHESKVLLGKWSRLERDTLKMESGPAQITLEDGAIRVVDTVNAKGVDKQPLREVEYTAGELQMLFTEKGEMEKLTGTKNAQLVSLQAAARTDLNAERLDLEFNTESSESELRRAMAYGKSGLVSKPLPRKGVLTPSTRILHSEVIELKMRPGGHEVELVQTHSPGTLEFQPNREGDHYRKLDGERMTIAYAAKNQLESFRSVNVTTKTKGVPQPGKPPQPDAITTSKNLLAHFDPRNSELTRLEQWDAFRYEAGERRATSDRAEMDQLNGLINLTGSARTWDASGSTAADRILMEQDSGDVTAEGRVTSTRLPDEKPAVPPGKDAKKLPANDSGSLFDTSKTTQAKADKMTVRDSSTLIRYAGKALMWQGSNRIEAETILIDSYNEKLIANGNVISQFQDSPKKPDPKAAAAKKAPPKPAAPVFTVVRAASLDYTDEDHLAYYKGGVKLDRPDMKVTSKELRAYLKKEDDGGTALERAFADGNAVIVQTAPGRKRTGVSENAEYDVTGDKVTLTGGAPSLVDTLRGTTRGKKITWFSKNDRLIVDGVPKEPATSILNRKKK